MDFIKGLYTDGLVEQQLDETAWEDIRQRRIERLKDSRAVAMYALVVGIENAVRAKNAAEMAMTEHSLPSVYVKSYLPIVELVDDIIQAGPMYIHQLRELHKRAKKKNT
jgi:hypothetical protein